MRSLEIVARSITEGTQPADETDRGRQATAASLALVPEGGACPEDHWDRERRVVEKFPAHDEGRPWACSRASCPSDDMYFSRRDWRTALLYRSFITRQPEKHSALNPEVLKVVFGFHCYLPKRKSKIESMSNFYLFAFLEESSFIANLE